MIKSCCKHCTFITLTRPVSYQPTPQLPGDHNITCLHSQPVMSSRPTQLWLSESIPNDDTAVTGLELATL